MNLSSFLSYLFPSPEPIEDAPRKALNRFYKTHSGIPTDYTVIDLETSGLDACTAEILEIGAIKYRNNVADRTFHSYIQPVGKIPYSASQVNGITWRKVCKAPLLGDIRDEFLEFIGNDVLVGHNVGFDVKFIQTRFELTLQNECLDTLELSKIAFPNMPSYKLNNLKQILFLAGGPSHTALGDCMTTHQLLQQIAKANIDEKIARNDILKKNRADSNDPDSSVTQYCGNGREFWEAGERARKNGDFDKALELFQRAESAGYTCPVLYSSYAMIYRKQKDYEKEISSVDKALSIYTGYDRTWFEDRKIRAENLLLASQRREEDLLKKEKARQDKAEMRRQKAEAKATKPKAVVGRPIAQLSDNGEILKEFASVSAASREVGVSEKSIRSAASGTQHHAGGFCWRYIDLSQQPAEIREERSDSDASW